MHASTSWMWILVLLVVGMAACGQEEGSRDNAEADVDAVAPQDIDDANDETLDIPDVAPDIDDPEVDEPESTSDPLDERPDTEVDLPDADDADADPTDADADVDEPLQDVDDTDPVDVDDATDEDTQETTDPADADDADGSDDPGDADADTDADTDTSAPEPLPTPGFTLITPAGLEDVYFHWDTIDPLTYGAGLAFVDTTGTGRLDLFVGQYNDQDRPACIYRNLSTPGALSFAPMEEICGQLGAYLGALPVDLTGDGRDELFLFGLASAGVLRFHPEVSYTPLDVRGSEDGPMQGCLSVSAMAVDVTLDGRPEIVVGCAGVAEGISDIFEQMESPDFRGLTEFKPNVVFRLHEDGNLVPASGPPYDAMAEIGSSLAMGPVELHHDGRDAIVFANDAHSTIFRRWTWLREGIVKFRCIADASCDFSELPMRPTSEAWGSYMGTTQVYVGDQPYIYLSDWGPNRLLRLVGAEFVDEAFQRNARVGVRDGYLAVGWAVLVDDFNYSGLDDIFVSNGLIFWDMQAYRKQVDSLLVQQPNGNFVELNEEIGMVPGAVELDDTLGSAYNARSGALVDLDGNGRLEVVLSNIAGPLIVYREDLPVTEAQPERCTLLPRERITAPLGLLFGIRGDGEERFRVRNAHGQMNIGLPRSHVTRWRKGHLRFPSGAIVPYDCGNDNGPLRIDEPNWLEVEFPAESTHAVVHLRRGWLDPDHRSSVRLHIRHADGSYTVAQHDGVAPHATLDVAWPETAEAVLVQHDGFWTRRWFTRPATEGIGAVPDGE